MTKKDARPIRNAALFGICVLAVACGSESAHQRESALQPESARQPAAAGWRAAVLVGDGGAVLRDLYDGVFPPIVKVAVDATGRGLAVWERREPNAIVASVFGPSSGWSSPIEVSAASRDTETADPDLAVNTAGAATVVWGECCPYWTTWMSRYQAGRWAVPEVIQPIPSATYATRGRGVVRPLFPRVLIDDTGSILAFWNQSDYTRPQSYPNIPERGLIARRNTASQGWTATTTLADDTSLLGVVAGNSGGTAVATFGNRAGAFISRFEPASGWRPPEPLAAYPAVGGAIAMNTSGDVLAAWATDFFGQYSGSLLVFPGIAARYYRPGTGWSEPQGITGRTRTPPGIALNAQGGGLVVWADEAGLWARRLEQTSGRQPVELAGPPMDFPGLAGVAPTVAIDPAGNAFVIVRYSAGVFAIRFERGRAWSPPQQLHVERTADGGPIRLAADSHGNAIAIWSHVENGKVRILASRYEARP